MRAFLAFRSLLFLILVPGTVAGYIPLQILRRNHQLIIPAISLSTVISALLTLIGALILLQCVWDFFATGRGTLVPFDPPKHLVVRGMYRYTRNPMYNGVLAAILGESWLFRSIVLVEYAAFIFIMFHLMVVFYEEPNLNSRFGESYQQYRRAVPRWGFTPKAFREQGP